MSKLLDRNDSSNILVAIAEIKKDMGQIFTRLDKINGSVADYQTTKERLSNACKDISEIADDIKNNIKPQIMSIKIKFYTIIGTTTLFTGAIGSAIGAAIVKATTRG